MATSYPGIGGVARSLPFDTATDPRKGAYLYEEFDVGAVTTGLVGRNRWTLTGTGGTAGYTAVTDHPGVLTLTAATSAFAAGITLPTFPYKAATGGGLYMAAQFRIPTALTNRLVRVGLTDAIAAATQPDNGIWLEYDAAVDADDWQVGADNASTDTQVVAQASIPAPVAATWYTVEIVASAGSAKVYLDGKMVTASANTNVTTASLSPFAYVGDGTNGATLDVDFVTVKAIVDRSGYNAVG